MQNNERQAGTEVQQSDAADVTMSSSHNAKHLVGCCFSSNHNEKQKKVLPLDEHIEIVNKKFPKYIVIEETQCKAMKSDAVLFKKQHYNEYCYLEYNKGCDAVSLTFFKCDWSSFEKIESEFLEGFSFCVKDKSETFVLINTLV